jgi:predicted ArsR family transcriptional regulator
MVKCSKAEVRRLKTALRWKIPVTQRQRIEMVLLRESGMTQPAIAAAMGVSLSTVNRAHMGPMTRAASRRAQAQAQAEWQAPVRP